MKIQVTVKNLNNTAAAGTTVETTVGPSETALGLRERMATVTNTLCFSDHQLRFNGKALPDSQRLSSCGIKGGDVLELSFQASDDTFVKQLSGLLGENAMTTEELGMLYSYRHLVSVQDALKVLGHTNGKLQDFLADQQHFSIDGCLVKVAKTQQAPKHLASPCSTQKEKEQGPIEVTVSIELHVPGKEPQRLVCDEDDLQVLRLDASESVAKAKEIIAASEQMPFSDCNLVLGEEVGRFQIEKKLADHLSLHDAGVRNGALLVMIVHASVNSLASQLEELLQERVGLSPNELSLHYCQRFGTPTGTALRTLGLPGNLKRFLEAQPQFSIVGGCVTMANGPELAMPSLWEEGSHDKTQIHYYTEKGEKSQRNDAAGPPCFQ